MSRPGRRGRRGRRGAREHPALGREALDRLPPWVAPVVYLVATVVLFREFLFSRDMLFGSDTLGLGYTARLFFAEALRTTGFPLWNPYILGGTPLIESLVGGDALYPISVGLFFLTEPYRALGWKLVIHVFLAGVFAHGWLRAIGVSRSGALLGGLAYLLAPWMVTLVFPGHDGKIFVTALAPLLFWMAEWSWHRRDLLPPALLALTICLVIFTTHFQMAYFLFGGVGLYMIFRAVEVGRAEGWRTAGRGFGIFLGFSLLGAGAGAVQLLPAVDYVTEHSRRTAVAAAPSAAEARAWSASWSLHPEEVVALAVPEFVGANVGAADWTTDTYWGRNPFKHNHEYLGVVVLLLAGLAFLGGPRSGLRWFMAGMGGLALLFALGAHTPVWRIFYEAVPGISLFRAPSMAIFLTGLAAVTLAALGFDRGVELVRTEEGRRRAVGWLGGAAAVLGLGALLAASGVLVQAWTALLRPDLTEAAAGALEAARPHITTGLFVATALAGGLAATFWAAGRGLLAAGVLTALVTLLVGGDLMRVNLPFVQVMDPARVTVPDANVRFLQERARVEPPFRVFSMMQRGQDVEPATFGLELAAGHHPNDLARYRELIGMVGSDIPEHLATFHPAVLGILNVRYVLWPDAQFGEIEGVEPLSRLQFPDGRPWASVYGYPGLPRGRVVGSYRVVEPGEAVRVILEDEAYDPEVETVLEDRPPFEPGGPGVRGEVRWVERQPNRLVFDVRADGPALVVVAENWFPSWRARVGDADAEVLRADHTLRAVAVPEGESRVEMWIDSPQLRRSLALSGLSLLLVTGMGFWAGLRRSARGREGELPEVPRA